ncbi:MAG: hypothetical protein EBR82_50565 [Caulobacteraceae bacterium]|nr:hypothetical protein [Caulobacteraceae bacterium]
MGRNKTAGVGLPGTEIVNPGGLSDEVIRAHAAIMREANAAVAELVAVVDEYVAGSDARDNAREAAWSRGDLAEIDRIWADRAKKRQEVTKAVLKAQSAISRDLAFSVENNSPIPEQRLARYREVLDFAKNYTI